MSNMTTREVTEAEAYEALRLAQIHEHEGPMPSSAKLAAQDAVAEFNIGSYRYAAERARTSLRYSVGVFHRDYATVANIVPFR
jgi:hypothetical protein